MWGKNLCCIVMPYRRSQNGCSAGIIPGLCGLVDRPDECGQWQWRAYIDSGLRHCCFSSQICRTLSVSPSTFKAQLKERQLVLRRVERAGSKVVHSDQAADKALICWQKYVGKHTGDLKEGVCFSEQKCFKAD